MKELRLRFRDDRGLLYDMALGHLLLVESYQQRAPAHLVPPLRVTGVTFELVEREDGREHQLVQRHLTPEELFPRYSDD